jgi:hypothetical protein
MHSTIFDVVAHDRVDDLRRQADQARLRAKARRVAKARQRRVR